MQHFLTGRRYNRDSIYDYHSEIHGTGNQIEIIHVVRQFLSEQIKMMMMMMLEMGIEAILPVPGSVCVYVYVISFL